MRCPVPAMPGACDARCLRCPGPAMPGACDARGLRCPGPAMPGACDARGLRCPGPACPNIICSEILYYKISGQFNGGCNTGGEGGGGGGGGQESEDIFIYQGEVRVFFEGSVITQYTFVLTVLILFFLSYLDVYPEFPNVYPEFPNTACNSSLSYSRFTPLSSSRLTDLVSIRFNILYISNFIPSNKNNSPQNCTQFPCFLNILNITVVNPYCL